MFSPQGLEELVLSVFSNSGVGHTQAPVGDALQHYSCRSVVMFASSDGLVAKQPEPETSPVGTEETRLLASLLALTMVMVVDLSNLRASRRSCSSLPASRFGPGRGDMSLG